MAHVSAICDNGHGCTDAGSSGLACDSSRLHETKVLTLRSLCRSCTWNTQAVNARLQARHMPQGNHAKSGTLIAPCARCALPECRVLPLSDRLVHDETPVLVVSDRQDAAILDSCNMSHPPHLPPRRCTAMRAVDEAMLQHRGTILPNKRGLRVACHTVRSACAVKMVV